MKIFKILHKIRRKTGGNQAEKPAFSVSAGNIRAKKGFTLAELIMSTVILSILIITGAGIYTNFYNSVRNLRASNLVYEETRFVMERIVKEIRGASIDYEEYYNQAANFGGSALSMNETYGQNYCEYSQQFYAAGPDGQFGTYDDESLGKRKDGSPAPIDSVIQDDLFLINANGNQRTYIKLLKGADGVGKIGMLKLVGKDYGMDGISADNGGHACLRDTGEKDGLIDTWFCEKGFNCEIVSKTILTPDSTCFGYSHAILDDPMDPSRSSFMDITPSALNITDIKFFLAPKDDPYKAYNDPSVQIQPHVTIKITAQAGPEIFREFKGKIPEIIIESTVSSRTYNEIITACNLQECIDGETRDCPKRPCPDIGICEAAQVTCSQGVWPICTNETYINFVNSEYAYGSLGDHAIFMGKEAYETYYESISEIGSCDIVFEDPDDRAACKKERCSDGFDNDGNGLADQDDPSCVWELCHNGRHDPPYEDCVDVGGVCYMRPRQAQETLCFDGYDNDCNGFADEFDQNCIDMICSDGIKSPTAFLRGNESRMSFLRSDYSPKNYLLGAFDTDYTTELNENCVDIGGLCKDAVSVINSSIGLLMVTKALQTEETGDFCYDGLDNDCSGFADELDPSCKAVICSNSVKDCGLVPSDYSPADYLVGYKSIGNETLCIFTTDLDEKCADIGGICGHWAGNENTPELCNDGIDNDCDGFIDQEDSDCCPDKDGDGFSPIVPGMCSPPPADPINFPYGQIDCDDNDPNIKPYDLVTGEPTLEICTDPADNNCSGINQWRPGDDGSDNKDPDCCIDADGDGYGRESAYLYVSPAGCFNNIGILDGNFDCNDSDPNIHPGATEICDGKDNNCDGKIDIDPLMDLPLTRSCYTGPPTTINVGLCIPGLQTCPGSGGWDSAPCVGEITPVTEICDGKDNDCDGIVDNDLRLNLYPDKDGDGYGDKFSPPLLMCPETGYVDNNLDCDDDNPSIHPDAPEICDDGIDNNCDGNIDEEGCIYL